MIKIYTENLDKILIKKLQTCYILIGNEESLFQENQNTLLFFAKKQGFCKIKNIIINIDADWEKIILIYKDYSLFFQKKIIVITYKLLNNINYFIEKLSKIYSKLNENIFLIIKLDKKLSSYYQKYINHLFKLSIPIILCYTLNINQWINWVNKKIDILKLYIHIDVKKILYKNYEGNLLALSNILKIFLLLYPKKIIMYDNIKNIIEHVAIFIPQQWIDAIFLNNKNRSIYIIHRFMIQKYNPVFLIRELQKNLIILITIKRNPKIKYQFFFNKYKIPKKRYEIFVYALKNSNNKKLYKMIKILTNIEINIKKNINYKSIWIQLKTLSLIF